MKGCITALIRNRDIEGTSAAILAADTLQQAIVNISVARLKVTGFGVTACKQAKQVPFCYRVEFVSHTQ